MSDEDQVTLKSVIVGLVSLSIGAVATHWIESWWNQAVPKLEPASVTFEGSVPKQTPIRASLELRLQMPMMMFSNPKLFEYLEGQSLPLGELETILLSLKEDNSIIEKMKGSLSQCQRMVEEDFPEGKGQTAREKFLKKFLDEFMRNTNGLWILSGVAIVTHPAEFNFAQDEGFQPYMQGKTEASSLTLSDGRLFILSPPTPDDPFFQMIGSSVSQSSTQKQSTYGPPPQLVLQAVGSFRYMLLEGDRKRLQDFLALVEKEVNRNMKADQDLQKIIADVKATQDPQRLHIVVVASNLGKEAIILRSDPKFRLVSAGAAPSAAAKSAGSNPTIAMAWRSDGLLTTTKPIVLAGGESRTLDFFSTQPVLDETPVDVGNGAAAIKTVYEGRTVQYLLEFERVASDSGPHPIPTEKILFAPR